MSKRAHADEIIKWASNKEAVVWYRNPPNVPNRRWLPMADKPSWLTKVEYKTILPEYAEAWQAWLDGELSLIHI